MSGFSAVAAYSFKAGANCFYFRETTLLHKDDDMVEVKCLGFQKC